MVREWRFFRARGGGDVAGQEGKGGVSWSEVFACLAANGFGNPDRLGRYTTRQLTLYYQAVQRMERHKRADLIEDILAGRVESDKQLRNTLQRIKELRK